MFEKFMEFWKTSDLMSIVYKEVEEMLKISHEMFVDAIKILLENVKMDEQKTIYDKDRKLNYMQIDVRKKTLEHLTISPAQDVIPSLIIITIVVDVERIGDYAKNLVELGHKYPEQLDNDYAERIKALQARVEKNFQNTIRAYSTGDKELGRRVMESHAQLAKECEKLVEDLIEDSSIGARLGIIFALLARFLKRVDAHLKNVASSVVNPFHRLGYKPQED